MTSCPRLSDLVALALCVGSLLTVGCLGDPGALEACTFTDPTGCDEPGTATTATGALVTTSGSGSDSTASAGTTDAGEETSAESTSATSTSTTGLPVDPPTQELGPTPPAEFYGLSGSDWGDAAGWDAMAKTGAKTVRMQINWPGIQKNTKCTAGTPPNPSYDWTDTDNRVRWAAERGVRYLPVVYGNACGDNHAFPDVSSPEYPQWLNFVDALVRRYGFSGTFWSDNPGLTPLPMKAWEIWNEQNYAINNPGGTVSPRKYARFLVDTSARIRSAQSAISAAPIEIVMGGLAPFNDATSIEGFFNTMINFPPGGDSPYYYTVAQLKNSFDGLGYHPYALAGDASAAITKIVTADKTLSDYGIGSKSIWLTEIGWPVGTYPWGKDKAPYTITPAMQKAYLEQTMDWLLENYASRNIKVVAWYNYKDFVTIPPGKWDGNAGLTELDGRKRPSWCAYVSYTSAPDCPKKPFVLNTPDIDRDPGTGRMLMSFVNEAKGVSVIEWSSITGFVQSNLGGTDATVATDTSVSLDPGTGRATIVYRRVNGQIGVWERPIYGKPWTYRTLGSTGEVSDATSPDLVRSGSQATDDLINAMAYRNAGGGISYWAESPDLGWVGPFNLGQSVSAVTSPSIAREPTDGTTEIAYRTSDGKVGLTTWTSAFGWTHATFGNANSVDIGASPKVARDPGTGLIVIPYRNNSDVMAAWYLPIGSWSWSHQISGTTIQPWANPSVAISESSGETLISFADMSGGASVWKRGSGGTWALPVGIGGNVALGSNFGISLIEQAGADNTVIPYVDGKYGLDNMQLGVILNWGIAWIPPVFW